MAIYGYNGYNLMVRSDQELPVAVFDPRFPRDGALYSAPSLDKAMRWVNAYRDGQQWAVEAKAS